MEVLLKDIYTYAVAVLIFCASAPALAADIPHRCDIAWLKKAQKIVNLNNTPEDSRHYLTTEPVAGGDRTFIDSGSRPNVCDAAVWRLLLESDAGLSLGWSDSLQDEIRILLAADALYYDADSHDEPISDDSTSRETALMFEAVHEQVRNTEDYQDLVAISESKKSNQAWKESIEGLAVATDLEIVLQDAGSVAIADGPNGRVLQYKVDPFSEQKMTIADINFERLLKQPLYRGRLAQKIADDIIARRPSVANAQSALADYRSKQRPPQ